MSLEVSRILFRAEALPSGTKRTGPDDRAQSRVRSYGDATKSGICRVVRVWYSA